ncbi:hypothetical protein CBR_g42111 [Chara braunii]|uniref:Protein kinase domain-containing protein n=1 Tax=Chara braunii TaxID=69332 RepID=A0A388LWY3_CHABU|nr:hypothetical protein CBR_g42111 [Chara braunii]|eukprot:GBG86828.1 hypothetical protein CBR_g42111 [Chara braunii]
MAQFLDPADGGQERMRCSEAYTEVEEAESGVELIPTCKRTEDDIKGGNHLFHIDVHASRPWVVFVADGPSLQVWDHEDRMLVASTQGLPSAWEAGWMAARFISREDWVVACNFLECAILVFEIKRSTQPACACSSTWSFRLKHVKELAHEGGPIFDLIVHPSLPYLLFSHNKNVKLWNWDEEWLRVTFRGHSDNVTTLAFHPQRSHIFASGARNGTIKVWNIENRSVIRTMHASEGIHNVQFCGNCGGKRKSFLVTGGVEGNICLWDYKKGSVLSCWRGHDNPDIPVVGVSFLRSLPFILAAFSDGTVRIWMEENYKLVRSYSTGLEDLCTMVACGACGNVSMFALGGAGSFLVVEVVVGEAEEKEEDFKEESVENFIGGGGRGGGGRGKEIERCEGGAEVESGLKRDCIVKRGEGEEEGEGIREKVDTACGCDTRKDAKSRGQDKSASALMGKDEGMERNTAAFHLDVREQAELEVMKERLEWEKTLGEYSEEYERRERRNSQRIMQLEANQVALLQKLHHSELRIEELEQRLTEQVRRVRLELLSFARLPFSSPSSAAAPPPPPLQAPATHPTAKESPSDSVFLVVMGEVGGVRRKDSQLLDMNRMSMADSRNIGSTGLELTLSECRANLKGVIQDIDMHPHKPWALFTSYDRSLHLWDYELGQQVAVEMSGSARRFEKAKFVAEKDWIVVVEYQRGRAWTIVVYEIQSSKLAMRLGKEVKRLDSWDDPIRCLAVNISCRYVLAVDSEESRTESHHIYSWEFGGESGSDPWREFVFEGHRTPVIAVSFHPTESHIFASAATSGQIKVWDIENRSTLGTLDGTPANSAITSLQFGSNQAKSLLITGHKRGDAGEVRVWEYNLAKSLRTLEKHEHAVVAALFHSQLPYVFIALTNGTINIVNASSYQTIGSFSSGLRDLSTMALSRSSDQLVVVGEGMFLVIEPAAASKLSSGNKTAAKASGAAATRNKSSLESGAGNEPNDSRFNLTDAKRMKELEKVVNDLKTAQTAFEEKFRKCQFAQEKMEAAHAEAAEKKRQLECEVSALVAEREAWKEKFQTSEIKVQELERRLAREETEKREEREGGEEREVRACQTPPGGVVHACRMQLQVSPGFPSTASSETSTENVNIGRQSFREFCFKELQLGTNYFDDNHKLEERHSGDLYVGRMTPVTVKRLKICDRVWNVHSTLKEEVVYRLRTLHHPHLQTLLGVCYKEKCLVYEFAENGSLKEWIADGGRPARGVLPWYVRLRIMAEIAKAVFFLHSSRSVRGGPIIHRAIRPDSIFLDTDFVAKIGEVDTALLTAELTEEEQVEDLCKSLGACSGLHYMAPEYLQRQVLDAMTDIYSLGINMMELLTGKLKHAFTIVEHAVRDVPTFKLCLDPQAGTWDVDLALEAAELALRCASLDRGKRPRMMMGDAPILPALEEIVRKAELACAVKHVLEPSSLLYQHI